jgi:hypothetical protein
MKFGSMVEDDFVDIWGLGGDKFKHYINGAMAFCVRGNGGIESFLLARHVGGSIIIDAIAAKERKCLACLMRGLFYQCGDSVEAIIASREANMKPLIAHGFYEQKDGSMIKIMHESTWKDGTYYPMGELVIEEILYGDGSVLGD